MILVWIIVAFMTILVIITLFNLYSPYLFDYSWQYFDSDQDLQDYDLRYEGHWPEPYWLGMDTQNNKDRYFDYSGLPKIHRHIDFGVYNRVL